MSVVDASVDASRRHPHECREGGPGKRGSEDSRCPPAQVAPRDATVRPRDVDVFVAPIDGGL